MSSNNNVTGTVAILGGTGDIGKRTIFLDIRRTDIDCLCLGFHISRIFLTEYRKEFPVVRITTRDPSSPKAQQLANLGAKLYKTSDSFDDVLSGVEVVVNALPTFISEDAKKELLAAIVRAGPKVSFLSEFGE